MNGRSLTLAALTLACLAPSMAVNLDHVVGHNSGLRLFALAATALMSVAAAALIPFTMRDSLQGGRRMEALGLAIMLLACWGFNVANGVGASSTSRADATGGRTADAQKLEQLRDDVAKLEAHREALAKTAGERTAGMIDAELAALRQNSRWSLTKGCTANVAADASREFCADYARLQGARDAAAKVEAIDANLEAMRKELRGATTADTAAPADPKASSIASGVLILAGLQVDPVAVGVALDWLQALVLELIASMGPVIATATLGLDKAAPETPTAPVVESARKAKRRPRRRHRMWAKLPRRPVAMPVREASPAPLAAAPAPVQPAADEPSGEASRPVGGQVGGAVGDRPVTQSHQLGGATEKPARKAAKKSAGRRKTPNKPPSKKPIPDNVLRFTRPVGGEVGGHLGGDVAGMAAKGLSTREIAAQTGLSRWQVRKRLDAAQSASEASDDASPAHAAVTPEGAVDGADRP